MADTLEVFGVEYSGVTGFKAKDTNSNQLTYIRPQGAKTINQNGTGIDVAEYASVDVNVSAPSVQTQTKSATPSETAQTITPDSGYYLSEVSVGAIPTTYVGSGIARRDSSDVDAGQVAGEYRVVTPVGYYESSVTKYVPNGSATAPATISGTEATVSAGTNTITLTKTVSVTPTVSAGYVLNGRAGNSSVSLTANVTTKAATTIHPSTSDQTIASGTYLTGAQTIKAVTLSNLTADNIKSGVTVTVGDSTDADCVASVTGTYSGGGSTKNIQVYRGYATTTATTYTATSVTITVAKTGTYNVSWMGYRNTTSGTSGSQLYRTRDGTATAIGTASTTFVNSYGQSVSLSNQSFNQGDILVVRARARSAQYIMGVGNLIIEEV